MSDFKLDRAAFNEHVLNADWMVDHLEHLMGGAKIAAEEVAPVYEQGPHPGRYKGAFHVDAKKHGGKNADRAEAVLYNDSPEALSVEFGTENNDAEHILTKALDTVRGRRYRRSHGKNTPRNG